VSEKKRGVVILAVLGCCLARRCVLRRQGNWKLL